MASSVEHERPSFRRKLLGWDPRQVEARVRDLEEALRAERSELARAEAASATAADIGQHLAALMIRFADSVAVGEREAEERAAAIVTTAREEAAVIETQAKALLVEARELAAATFAEAGRRYEAATEARQTASERIEAAIEQMADYLAALNAMPDFPELALPVPVLDDEGSRFHYEVQGDGEVFHLRHAASQPAANATSETADSDAIDDETVKTLSQLGN